MLCPNCNTEMEDMRHREDHIDWWCNPCKLAHVNVWEEYRLPIVISGAVITIKNISPKPVVIKGPL